ncbi:PTS sugar transporter subunit IIC [bacterium]|nr:PTS sugar transporter subunit IIC [bacterium]
MAALAGAVVHLDTSVIGQTLIGQPIIACTLYGWIAGRPEVGLFFGILFELLWLANLQIGAAKFAEGNLGAIIATITACEVAPSGVTGEPAWIVLLLCFALGMIFAQIGREISPFTRRVMIGIADRFVLACAEGREMSLRGWTLAAFGLHAAVGAGFVVIGLLAGRAMLRLYFGEFYALGPGDAIVNSTDNVLSGMWPALLGAGAGAALLQLVSKRDWMKWALVAAVFTGGALIW